MLDLTLPEGAENLALDEALLLQAEEDQSFVEVLRLWEPRRPMVVLGRSSKIAGEVHVAACRELEIPVLRRTSGGATIITGPGCLMYTLVLSRIERPALRSATAAHRFVLETTAAALAPLVPGLRCRGTSDLAVGELKFSGNSIRMKRDHLLYHGTLLYDFPLELIERCLRMPPRTPDYRRRRSHGAFVTNLPLAALEIRSLLIAAWDAVEPLGRWPRERTARLVDERYARREWNER